MALRSCRSFPFVLLVCLVGALRAVPLEYTPEDDIFNEVQELLALNRPTRQVSQKTDPSYVTQVSHLKPVKSETL